MRNPNPVNLMASEEVRSKGWLGSAPVLGMMCGCGARIERACEAVAVPSTTHDIIEVGWSYDERGFARCPDCRDGRGAPRIERRRALEQGRLL